MYTSAPAAPVSYSTSIVHSVNRRVSDAGSREDSCLSQQQQGTVRGRALKVDLSGSKYELFSRHVASRLGWQLVPPGSCDWDLCWLDTSVSQERLLKLQPTQRINHFYGMLELARKRPMARTVSALAVAAAAAAAAPPYPTLSAPSNLAPQLSAAAESAAAASSAVAAGCPTGGGPVPSLLLDFMPESWVLPQQLTAFLAAAQAGGRKVPFIVKPDAGCQGRGIRIIMGGPEAQVLASLGGAAAVEAAPAVAQRYLANPLLVNGLKFDLRVYCLVTSIEPLRVFLYHEGLVRFCTTPYKRPTAKNSSCSYMHLTNYAVNKHNTAAFVAPTTAAAATAPQPTATAPSTPPPPAAAAAAGVTSAAQTEAAPVLSSAIGCCDGSQPAVQNNSSSADGRDHDWQQQQRQQQQQELHKDTADGLAEESHGAAAAAAAAAAVGGGEGQGGDASKWSFQQLRRHLEAQGADWPQLWSRISQLVTKSLIAVTPHLAASYKTTVPGCPSSTTDSSEVDTSTNGYSGSSSGGKQSPGGFAPQRRTSSSSDGCSGSSAGGRKRGRGGPSPGVLAAMHGSRCFELLGFDVLIDADLKPWLVEVNHSPSFNIDSPLDRTIKEALIVDTIKLVRMDAKAIAAAKRAAHNETQARLLTATHCRGVGSSGGGSSSSPAVQLEAQQAQRSAILASMDAWQSKHLGGYERAYPLTLPNTTPFSWAYNSSSSSSSSRGANSRPNTSSQQREQHQRQEEPRQQWQQYAQKQQELYDQLLLLSQSVYLQQTQRQQQQPGQSSPVRLQGSPTVGSEMFSLTDEAAILTKRGLR